MKITCLMENTSVNEEFISEHGLSLYIETEKYKILFDFGQSDAYLKNADKLGVDLSKVDYAILSHGHYDHGGGIESFLKINNKAKIYVNENVFNEHYHGEKYIGLDTKLKNNDRFVLIDKDFEIDKNIKIYNCNDSEIRYPMDCAGLSEKVHDQLIPEKFNHEQYLMISENNQKILFSGCSHKGILNIMHWFTPDILLGGFHFVKQEIIHDKNDMLDKCSMILNSYDTIYYTCHCTGVKQYEYMKEKMGDKLHYLSAGEVLSI